MTDNLNLFAQSEPPPNSVIANAARAICGQRSLILTAEVVGMPPELHIKRKRSHRVPLRTIQEGFEAFITRNPHVVELVVAEAREWKLRGFQHYGMAAIWEHVRYSIDKRSVDSKPFKMPNNYRSRMARYVMANYPDLDGFFTTAELRSE